MQKGEYLPVLYRVQCTMYACMYHSPHKRYIQAIKIMQIDTIQYFKVKNVKEKHP